MPKTNLPTSALILCILYGSMIFSGFIAPFEADHEFRLHPYEPPTTIHIRDHQGNLHFPYIFETKARIDENYKRTYQEISTEKHPIKLFVEGDPYTILGIPFKTHLFGTEKGVPLYLLGSDSRGRDVFSRLLYGSRVSLSIGLLGVLISMSLGCLIGGLSGYIGGRLDWLLMRITEMLMLFPGFYLLLTLRAIFPPTLTSTQVYLLIIVILSFIGWAGLARIIRGQILALKSSPHVLALKGFGIRDQNILLRHLLPSLKSYLIVTATLAIPGYILGESALSLIGLGIQEPQVSWGTMLAESMAISHIKLHPWILTPGILIIITVLSFNLLGDHLRDKLDIKLR